MLLEETRRNLKDMGVLFSKYPGSSSSKMQKVLYLDAATFTGKEKKSSEPYINLTKPSQYQRDKRERTKKFEIYQMLEHKIKPASKILFSCHCT